MFAKLRSVAVLLCASVMIFGCMAAGLKRTPLDCWKTRKFDDIGIELSLPQNALLVEVIGSNKSWLTLSFRLHRVSSGIFMAEPLYLVSFNFDRLNRQKYNAFRKGEHMLTCYPIMGTWYEHEFTNTVRFAWKQDRKRNAYGWRRDYLCANGDVVLASVEQILIDQDPVSAGRDTDAIERVLNSVRVYDCEERGKLGVSK